MDESKPCDVLQRAELQAAGVLQFVERRRGTLSEQEKALANALLRHAKGLQVAAATWRQWLQHK